MEIIKKIRKYFKMARNKYWSVTNPVGYAKRIGVNFPEGGLHIYGRISWSTRTLDYYFR